MSCIYFPFHLRCLQNDARSVPELNGDEAEEEAEEEEEVEEEEEEEEQLPPGWSKGQNKIA